MINYLTFKKEIDFLSENPDYTRIVGIDEVGRGCLAGPVFVGAFIFDTDHSHIENVIDSKKVPFKKREEIFKKVDSEKFILKDGSSIDIDTKGIARVIEALISEIIMELNDERTFFLIDGVFKKDFGVHSRKIIKGDYNFYSIALASIIAKVNRDRLMRKYSLEYPKYRFDLNKGYATKFHREAIKLHGMSDLHRRSFKLKEIL